MEGLGNGEFTRQESPRLHQVHILILWQTGSSKSSEPAFDLDDMYTSGTAKVHVHVPGMEWRCVSSQEERHSRLQHREAGTLVC